MAIGLGTSEVSKLNAEGLSKAFYVDNSRTDSYTETGTVQRPYKTFDACLTAIKAAYTAATDKQTTTYVVTMAGGTYAEDVEINTVKHLRIQGIGVVLSGTIFINQSPIGGSGEASYTRLEFIGQSGSRAEKGSGFTISGAITGTRTNDSLTYISFKGCWISGNQLYDGDGTFVTQYEGCRISGTIDTGTFTDPDSAVLIETTGYNRFSGAITDKVSLYNVNNANFTGAIAITPVFDCTIYNSTFSSTVSIVASKNLTLDSRTLHNLNAQSPTLTGMTVYAPVSKNITIVDSATYDVLTGDDILHVTYTSTSAVTSLTLPTAQCTKGRTLVIKDAGGLSGTNSITIDTEGAETIDGEATVVINSNYSSINLYSDGSNWFIF